MEWREQETIRMYEENFDASELRGKRIVDFGCGDTKFCEYAASRGAITAVGMDISARAIGELSARNSYPNVFYKLALPGKIPLDPQSVDTIVCLAAMEHIMEWREIISEWGRILVPGGKVCIWWMVWWHPYGHHQYAEIPVPWLHVLLDDAAIFRIASRVYDSPRCKTRHWHLDADGNRRRNPYLGLTKFGNLNRLTSWQFERAVQDNGLVVLRREPQPFRRSGFKLIGKILASTPRLCDFFSSAFVYELQKPSHV